MTDRVRRVSWQSFRAPMRRPFGAAHGTLEHREGLVIRLETGAGTAGLGEASPLPAYAGGSIEEASGAIETLARSAVGQQLAECWSTSVPLAGLSPGSVAAARCGFETAVADALAQENGLPLWAWLAGSEAAAVTLPVNAIIDAGEAADAASQGGTLAAQGFSTFKVKVGTGRQADTARVRAVREAVGSGASLRVDANGAWDEATARAMLAALAAFDLALCEQPVARGATALAIMARLRVASSIPLAADESCRSLADLEEIIRLHAAGAAVVKPMVTGLREAVAMLAAARRASLAAIVTTTFDSGIGVALAMHVAALLPEPRPACGLATLGQLESPLAHGVPPVHLGMVTLPDSPGLGVTLDGAALHRYAGSISGEVSA